MPRERHRRSATRHADGVRIAALITTLATIALFTLGTPASAGGRTSSRPRMRIAEQEATREGLPFFDIREGAPAVRVPIDVARARVALARSLGTQGVVEVSPVTGTPRVLTRLDGFLTGPSAASARSIVLDYVRAHLSAFGLSGADLRTLHLVKDYVDILGTHHLIWQQRYRGIPLFDSDLRASVTKDGRLVNVMGAPVAGLAPRTTTPLVSAGAAASAVRRNVGAPVASPGPVTKTAAGAQRATSFASGDMAALVLFARSGGATLAWKVLARVSSTKEYLSVVDAVTGRVLYRENQVKFDSPGTGYVWPYYPGPGLPNNGGLPQQPLPFPVASDSALSGNNAHVFLDFNDDDKPDPGDEIAATAPGVWQFPVVTDTTTTGNFCSTSYPCTWNPQIPFSWQANAAQDATQVYYFLNTFHDHLLASPIGFTEAAGNFQVVNSTGQGKGGDPVLGNTDDGANADNGLPDNNHIDNANMSTPPDGQSPRMQMYLFYDPQLGWEASNGGDDASVVYHEYTHGLSNRLITFADGTGAVSSAQSGAMGEAWSDWYALDYLVRQGFIVDGPGVDVMEGTYVTRGLGIRTEFIDCPVGSSDPNCGGGKKTGAGGYTYGDFGKVLGFPEVHADGEIWAQTLWDIRTALGSDKAEALITRGMELSPPEPSFLDERNAIIEADNVAYGGADVATLWQIFANRGMGFFASAIDGGDVHPVEDFSLPPDCSTDCATVSGTLTDSVTHKPVKGALVGFAGHMSGLASDLAATTDGSGAYSIANVPFHAYEMVVKANGYEPLVTSRSVSSATQTINLKAVRDWASLSGGAKLTAFTRPDYTPFGCGPSGAIDGTLSSGWGSDSPNNKHSGVKGPRSITVKLPKAVDVKAFAVASNGTCGDGPDAAVKGFMIQTRSGHHPWMTAVLNTANFKLGQFVVFKPGKGTNENVTFIRFTMTSNHGNPLFMDMLEVSVRGA